MRLKMPYFIFCICLYKIVSAQNELKISIDSIPQNIKQSINRKHINYQIIYCSKLIASNKQISYNIILQKGNKEIDLIYTEVGKMISRKKIKYYVDDEKINEQNYKTPFPNL